MNKKGLYVASLSVIILAVFVIGYNIDRLVKEKNVALDKVGVGAIATLNSFYEGGRVEYFVDEAAKYSTLRALDLMGENGGIYDKEECVDNDYVVWKENCEPKNLNIVFMEYFNDSFNEYLSDLDLKSDDFGINVYGGLNVKGEIKEKYKLDIVGILKSKYNIEINEKKLQITLKNLEKYMDIIGEKSRKYDVPEILILAVITQESGGNINAVSEAGCYGLMQICPGPHPYYFDGSRCNGKSARDSVECNIEAGVEIMRRYYDQYKNGVTYKCDRFCDEKGVCQEAVDETYYDWEASTRAYNGLGCGGYPDYTYVEKIMKWYELLNREEISVERIGSYYIEPDFFVEMDYYLGDYNEIKKAAENCLSDSEKCIGNDKYNLIKNEQIGNIMAFEFKSKENIGGIKPIIVKFGLPV